MLQREDVLLVDGYNIIGAWPELATLKYEKLENARDRLLELMADYQGFSGVTVIVVFDAYHVSGGTGSDFRHRKLRVVFTRERETADECIERLVGDWISVKRNVYVATSDLTEQHVAFGRGALRVTARELKLAVEQSRSDIQTTIRREPATKRNTLDSVLNDDIWRRLELMRRGQGEKPKGDGDN
ncbi:NYN domain-containing protein [Cohnella yongneupensis]|uniref:NYN domain-containing protein n=1 Tax=Cohnella yongneupensis TaxID=425006 RepID=A0ABW0QV54_9BACL